MALQSSPPLRAGAASACITPALGTHLAGSGAGPHCPAQTVLDPLYAKAVVCDNGASRLCILSLDGSSTQDPWQEENVRHRLQGLWF